MEYESLGFSEFRSVLDHWDRVRENQAQKDIEAMVEGNDFVLFFLKDNIIFGAPEESRMTFARMKHPDDEDGDWMREATFSAYNLSRALKGESAQAIFGEKDLGKIKIIDKDEAIEKLIDESDKLSPDSKNKAKMTIIKAPKDDQSPGNMGKVDEK